MDPDVLLLLVLDGEPDLFGTVQPIDELEEGAPLEEVVAELVFEVGQELEEVGTGDLRVPHHVPEGVG